MVGCRSKVLPMLFWVLLLVAHSPRHEVLAAGQQRHFPPTDELVSVVATQSHVSAGSSNIESCLNSASPPSFRVRFQKLKGKTATFTRTLLNKERILTYASRMKTVSTTKIANCMNLADAEGFVGFAFKDGKCTLFNIEPQSCGCETGGQDVFYVQDSYWAPKGRPGIFLLNLIHGLSSILALWEPCDPACPSTAAKFQLSWNSKIIVLNRTTFNYTLDNDVSLCTQNLSQVASVLKDVTLKAFDNAGTLMKTVSATLTNRTDLAGKRYLLNSSNCLYYDATKGASFDVLEEFCRTKLHSTMFIEYVDGDFSTYRRALIAMMSYIPPIDVYYHYAGLRQKDGNWTWLSGLPQPTEDPDVWKVTPDEDECGEVQPDQSDHKLDSVHCKDTSEAFVCHTYFR